MPPTKKDVAKKIVARKQPNRRIKKTTKTLVPSGPKMKKISPPAPGVIRIVILGGVEEVGKNMAAIEIGNDIIVIDAGIQFPDEDSPGVDYIIADSSYLEERKNRIRGLILTHGHLDHIGGIPYIVPKLGNPPVYTALLTAVMIKKRQEEFPHLPKLNIQVITGEDRIKLGQMPISFFSPTHTIPDSIGIVIGTTFGNIIFTGDIKIETENGQAVKSEQEMFNKLAKEKTLCLIADSTNVEKPGFSRPEKEVQANLKKIIAGTKGRVVVSTFASLFDRIIFIIKASEELGKKVVVEGRSMKNNVEIAKELGILKVKRDTIIGSDAMDEYPDNKIVVLATGAQGDAFAALMRISNREHKSIKIRKNDTVLLSSSIVPGNEKGVQKLKDNLSRQGAKILHYGIVDIHSSGHSYQDEVKWVHKVLQPKFFIPVHGHHFMLRVHSDVAQSMGMSENNIVIPDNGMIIEIADRGRKIIQRPEKAGSRLVMVDGLGNDNIKEVVIRDRQMLSQDGMFVIIATIDANSGQVRKSPDIISRGFVYLKESQELLNYVRRLTKKTIEERAGKMHPINIDYLKNNIREEIGKYLYQKTLKRPIILPVLIEV